MMGLSSPQVSGAWRFRIAAVLTAALVTTWLLLLAGDLPSDQRRLVSDTGLIGGGVAAAFSCGHRYRHSAGRRRRAWWCLAMGGVIGALGNIWVLAVRLTNGSQTAEDLGNIGFIAALLLGMTALVFFPSVRRRRFELGRMILDGLVIGGSALTISSILVFPEVLSAGSKSGLTGLAVLILPITDVALATLAVLLIVRSSREDRPALALVSSGFVLYAVADLAYAVLTARHTFSFGTPVDVGWIAGYLLIALAARHPAAGVAHPDGVPKEASPVAGTVVTFAVFLTAALVRVFSLRPSDLGVTSSVLWMCVLLAVTARQVLLITDNERLRQSLERRVSERTADLRRLTRRSELLLRSVADGIYGVDRSGLITFANPVAADILGYRAEDLIGKDAHVSFHAVQEDGTAWPAESCYITEAVRDAVVTHAEEDVYVRADGRRLPVEVTASPLSTDHSVEGAVVVFRDITQRREVDRLKSEFVSIVSHELRTPLTSIRGSLGLLAGGALGTLPPGANRMIDIALDSSERLTRLINDILDIERIESGALPMETGDYRADELIESAASQVQILAAEAEVQVTRGIVNGRVHADADRVVQTLINLLGNAIKFSPPGSEVMVSAAPRGALVQFTVSDHGRGIPSDKLESVFSRFEQVDSSDAREKGGTGLGLAISRSLVERLGGRIWAEHNRDGGSRFCFTLPRAFGSDDHDDSASGPLLVVCDDDEYVVEVLSELLQRRGYRVVGVTEGAEAVQVVTSELPAAVVLDLAMPGTSGSDVVAALKRQPQTRDIPIVVVSGLSPDGHPGLAAQTAGWLVKPVDEERLSDNVASAIADHRVRGAVLLVEDDADLAKVIRVLFQRRGLTVYHATTKAEALQHAQAVQPQVLVLDLQLPDGDGAELVAELRRNSQLAQMPVVVYSGVDVSDTARDALRLGQTLFLTKARVTPQQVEDRVVELLDVATGKIPGDGAPTELDEAVAVKT